MIPPASPRSWPLALALVAVTGCGHAAGARDETVPPEAVDGDAIARCEAAVSAGASAEALVAACSGALPAPRCATALRDEAPREALTACAAALCPALAIPRPLACGLDPRTLTPVGVHDVFIELVAHSLTPALGEARALSLARGFGDGAFTPPERHEPAAARVNGVAIPQAELAIELRRAAFVGSDGAPPTASDVLSRLVDRELLRQLSAREGITLTDAEIEAEYDAFVAAAPPGFVSWITAAGRGATDIRAMVVEKLAVEKLLEERGALVVAEDAQRAFYDAHPERFSEPEKRHVWEIFVAAPRGTPQEERLAAFEKVVAAHEALVGGEPFDAVARRFSDGRRAGEGGDLGLVPTDVFPPEVAAAVLELDEGELSRPLLTDIGFHLIRVGERRAARRIPFSEARPWIAEYLRARTFRSERERLLEDLREQARIEIL